MPRFAILAHDHPSPHWDLFLEAGPVLRSWRLLQPLRDGVAVPAEQIGDHRLMYLDYEGPVSGGRGTVKRIDAGTFTWKEDGPEKLAVLLAGRVFYARLVLIRNGDNWTASIETISPE
jgi:hypothetical protein